MTTRAAFIAANRFGLGPRPGDLGAIAGDPRSWLAQQIAPVAPTPAALEGLRSGVENTIVFQKARQRGDAALQMELREGIRATYLAEAAARTRAQIESDAPFRERLVAFWSNHFTVSVQRPAIVGLAGAFEREAIRPYACGRFADMLRAVCRHQAMLLYLDNAISVGPDSRFGKQRQRGLNENLAREILELHTLGVNGGYTQGDVREFAKILTGWSIARLEEGGGSYRYYEPIHQPGDKVLLGVRYAEAGEREGETALLALARHPSTANHIASKFARHFIADRPPAAAIERLAGIFRDTDGDLAALARAVVEAPEAWVEPMAKVKTPVEFVVSAFRATALEAEPERLVGSQRLFGQAPFAAPSPAGWPDTADQWIGPESVLRRAEWAMALALRAERDNRPLPLFEATIAPVAASETRAAILSAASLAEGIALVIASAEFQRR